MADRAVFGDRGKPDAWAARTDHDWYRRA